MWVWGSPPTPRRGSPHSYLGALLEGLFVGSMREKRGVGELLPLLWDDFYADDLGFLRSLHSQKPRTYVTRFSLSSFEEMNSTVQESTHAQCRVEAVSGQLFAPGK